MNGLLENKQKAAEIFRVLAELYKPPTSEFWNELNQENLLHSLHQTSMEVFGLDAQSLIEALPADYEQFNLLFKTISDGEKAAALPVESLYKPWTQDSTCTLPFAKSKGYLQGDSALHIRYLLNEFQIQIPPEYAGMPDHITILLELLAYFIEFAQEEFTKQFITDHFDWLEEFSEKHAEVSGHPFYLQVTGYLIKVLDAMLAFEK